MTAEEFLKSNVNGTNPYVTLGVALTAIDMARREGISQSRIDAVKMFQRGTDVDWQQVRIQTAIAVMQGLSNAAFEEIGLEDVSEVIICEHAVRYADALVEELKKKGE